jgi:Gametolysin peptidase M11
MRAPVRTHSGGDGRRYSVICAPLALFCLIGRLSTSIVSASSFVRRDQATTPDWPHFRTGSGGVVSPNVTTAFSVENDGSGLDRTLQQAPSIGSAGTLRVLMIRVSTSDAAVSLPASHLDSLIFRDTAGGQVSLASQLAACSGGKLQLEPTYHRVLDIQLPQSVVSRDRADLAAAAGSLALDVVLDNKYSDPFFGSSWNGYDMDQINDGIFRLQDYAGLLMYIVPPGATSAAEGLDWVGRGIVDGKETIFNDEYGSYLAVQAHEIGHNFNLKHAGKLGLGYVL